MMAEERCNKWEPVTGIESPCPKISFEYRARDALGVRMHFSSIQGSQPKDLLLIFCGVIAIHWEDELFGFFHKLPEPVPKLVGKWSIWRFPLLRIENSAWLATFEAIRTPSALGLTHFALTGMDDLMDILAKPKVETVWVEAAQ